MKTVYIALQKCSVDGRGPDVIKGVFEDLEVAERWASLNTYREIRPFGLVQMGMYENRLDMAEQLERDQKDLEKLTESVKAQKQALDILDQLG